ncbi:MAG: type III secretion system chaperone [Puniceicoccales bacterium]|nr:type III secretion system chaperone [Puniceicoccales bacterium]
MKGEGVVQLIALEFGVFHLNPDVEGAYAIRMANGRILRIFIREGEAVLLECQLLSGVIGLIRSPERLMHLLKENFVRAIQKTAIITYLKELDELVLSQALPRADWEEQKISEQVRSLLADVKQMDLLLQQLFFLSGLPSNPHSAT